MPSITGFSSVYSASAGSVLLDFSWQEDTVVILFLCLIILLTIIYFASRFFHVVTNGRLSFYFMAE
jgi:hypothetical protein